MNQLGFPILSTILWLPMLGALVLLLMPRSGEAQQRQITIGVMALTFVVSCVLPFAFDWSAGQTGLPGMQFVDSLPWVPSWGINYLISIDGVSLWLVLLTTFLSPIAVLASADTVQTRVRHFLILLLLLESAMLGVFMSQDMFLFYIFWEFTLIPAAFLIGIWGGANRVYAATKFFIYTFAASVLMLLAIIGLYIVHRNALLAATPGYPGTFDIAQIVTDIRNRQLVLGITTERLLFGGFFAAFAVKAALWPFHTWLPDAYTEAPAPASAILAGVLAKLGTYGLIRFNLMLFPDTAQWAAPAIGTLAVIGILYGAAIAFAQTDMKKLVAYSSISHMSFIILGTFALNAIGVSGAVLQMVNHGLSTGALFLVVGLIEARRNTRELSELNGLWKVMPIYGSLALVLVLSSMGLPGLNGFIGEYTLLQGTMGPNSALGWPFVGFAVIGVILSAVYLLRMYRGSFMGDVTNPANQNLPDLSRREITTLALLLIPIIVIGLYPNLLFGPMQSSVASVVQGFSQGLAGR